MRIPIPQATADRVLVENMHTCCLCRSSGRDVQLHHINEDPSDNAPENLAVLCLDCHGRVTRNGGLGRAVTPSAVRLYKVLWEVNCALQTKPNFGPTLDRKDGFVRMPFSVTDSMIADLVTIIPFAAVTVRVLDSTNRLSYRAANAQVGRLAWANKQYEQFVGKSTEMLIGKTGKEIFGREFNVEVLPQQPNFGPACVLEKHHFSPVIPDLVCTRFPIRHIGRLVVVGRVYAYPNWIKAHASVLNNRNNPERKGRLPRSGC